MRSSTVAYIMVFLMTLSVTPLSGFSGTTEEANTNSSESDLEPIKIDLSAEGRQSAVETAHWEFDTTSFGLLEVSTSADGSDSEMHPCQPSWGWRSIGNTVPQIPFHEWMYNNLPDRYSAGEHQNCHSWRPGAENGYHYNGFEVSSNGGDGTTDYAVEHTSHDVGGPGYHAQWIGKEAPGSGPTYNSLDAENIVDMDIDSAGNTYVVGSWDAQKLVFPNKVGTHVYLENSGIGSPTDIFMDIASDDYEYVNSNHDQDIFVAKMDPNGEWLWATSVQHHGIETASSIAVSSVGDVYVGGTIQNIVRDGSEDSTAYFFDSARSTGTSSNAISLPSLSGEPYGFVASLDTNGGFTNAKPVETRSVFSSVTDIALDAKNDETLYFIGKIGGGNTDCISDKGLILCPDNDSYMVGKMMTDYTLTPNLWSLDWVEFLDEDVTLTEIEMTIDGAIVTGFTDESSGVLDADDTIPAESILVAKVNSQTDSAGDAVWSWSASCNPPNSSPTWKDEEFGNPSWGLSVSSTHAAVLVEPGSICGSLASNYFGFQVVSLDINDGTWVWANGDVKDTANLPLYLQFQNDAHASDLDFASNGDAIISVNLGKIVMVNGSNFIPQDGVSDILLLRFDDDTGTKIWHHQEINSECAIPLAGYDLSMANTCPDFKRGGADSRRVVVKGLDDIYISGMVYGKEIYFHDGLPEHCDYDYAGPIWEDPSGQYVTVPNNLQGYLPPSTYLTKCSNDATTWVDASGQSLPNNWEEIYPKHGTQWHGGDAYYAMFDACPLASGSTIDYVDDSQISTEGRNEWYVGPIGEPTNIDPNRGDCEADGTYPDPDPIEDILGCTHPYAINYDPAATFDDGSCIYDTKPPTSPLPPQIDPCDCNPFGSIANMTESGDLASLHIMEITSPLSAGSPQGPNAGFYYLELDFLTTLPSGGMLSTKLTDSDMMSHICDLMTSARECYDFYTSDEYGNYDSFGEYIGIRTYNAYMHAGNIDAVWLEMTDGTNHYAADIVYFNHGNAPPGTSSESEILGEPSNDPSVIPVVNPTGFTALGPQFTTIVLCFDTAPTPVVVVDDASNDDDDDDDDSTLPSMSLVATLGVAMLAAFVSRRKD